MRGQEFKVRDKKVQKMTRDGLTEKNLTQGTQQRISTRLEEISSGRNGRQTPQPGTDPRDAYRQRNRNRDITRRTSRRKTRRCRRI